MDKKPESSNPSAVDRRGFLARAGMALAGSSMLGAGMLSLTSLAEGSAEEFSTGATSTLLSNPRSAMKPVYLPPHDNKDPVAHSLADNVFWNEIMMEHAMFFVLLMPGADLAPYRTQAQNFQVRFARHLALIRRSRISKANYRVLNQRTIALVKPFLAYKQRMLELQSSGKMRSLVWPLFWAHTVREARRFITRLEMYSLGKVEFERSEVVEFWTSTMGEHAQFIAHLLDPQEVALIQRASAKAASFLGVLKDSPQNFEALLLAGEDIIDFKTAAEIGIETGKIKSIIHPALADHVRREAVKYVDELKRS